eukprot:COSAG01_NODE_361_length_18141_cov_34.624619_6_plen_265_part_00
MARRRCHRCAQIYTDTDVAEWRWEEAQDYNFRNASIKPQVCNSGQTLKAPGSEKGTMLPAMCAAICESDRYTISAHRCYLHPLDRLRFYLRTVIPFDADACVMEQVQTQPRELPGVVDRTLHGARRISPVPRLLPLEHDLEWAARSLPVLHGLIRLLIPGCGPVSCFVLWGLADRIYDQHYRERKELHLARRQRQGDEHSTHGAGVVNPSTVSGVSHRWDLHIRRWDLHIRRLATRCEGNAASRRTTNFLRKDTRVRFWCQLYR